MSLWRDLVRLRRGGQRPEMVAVCFAEAVIPQDVMRLAPPPVETAYRWLTGLEVVVVTDDAHVNAAIHAVDLCLRVGASCVEVFNAEARRWAIVLCGASDHRVQQGVPAWD